MFTPSQALTELLYGEVARIALYAFAAGVILGSGITALLFAIFR